VLIHGSMNERFCRFKMHLAVVLVGTERHGENDSRPHFKALQFGGVHFVIRGNLKKCSVRFDSANARELVLALRLTPKISCNVYELKR